MEFPLLFFGLEFILHLIHWLPLAHNLSTVCLDVVTVGCHSNAKDLQHVAQNTWISVSLMPQVE
jgi:hypothetical protein